MIPKVLGIICLSLISPTVVLANELTGLWNCEFTAEGFSGHAKMSFQADGNLSARLNGKTADKVENKIEFSIRMLWRYHFENGLLTTDPLRATDARVSVDGVNAPQMAREFETELLAPNNTPDRVEFQGKSRMTLTDEDGVTYCKRAKRCPNFGC